MWKPAKLGCRSSPWSYPRASRPQRICTSPDWHTLAQFGQDTDPEVIRAVLRDEELRFSDLMTRGRKVLARFGSGRPPTPEDLSYLHQTHGLPPDLVTEILTGPGETSKGMLGQ